MKTPLITLFLAFSLLNAEPKLTDGIALYEETKYAEAYDLFAGIFTKNLASPEFNFYYGLVCVKLSKTNEAIAAFERVLLLNPTHERSKLELASIYYRLEMYPESKALLYELKANKTLPETVQANIDALLESMDSKGKGTLIVPFLILSTMYDSNVSNGNELLGGTFTGALKEGIGLSELYMLSSKIGLMGVLSEVYGGYYGVDYFDSSLFGSSIDYFFGGLKPSWDWLNARFEMPINYAKLYYGSVEIFDLYSLRTEYAPKGQNIKYFFQNDYTSYLSAFATRSSNKRYYGVSLPMGNLLSTLHYAQERAIVSGRVDVDNNEWLFKITQEAPTLKHNFQIKKRDDTMSQLGTVRNDIQLKYDLSYKLTPNLNLGYAYTKNSSNLSIYDYQKQMVTIGYTYQPRGF